MSKSMIKGYREFGTPLAENVQKAKSILAKKGIDKNNEDYQTLRNMLTNKMGWVGAFTSFRFEDNIRLDDLVALYDKMMAVEPLLKNMSQPIDKYETYEQLTDDIDALILRRKVTRFYQELTSTQKAGFKTMTDEQRDRLELILPSFFDVLRESQQKEFFIKITQYKTFKALLDNFETYVAASLEDFTMERVLEMVDEIEGGAKVVHRDDRRQLLVVRLLKFEASELLNRATHWCIRNSRSNWDGYVNSSSAQTQYTVYDFKKKYSDITSMIAITVAEDGSIHEAAYKNNNHITESEVFRVADSKKYRQVLRPIEGEELVRVQKLKNYSRTLISAPDADQMPHYLKTFREAYAEDAMDSEMKGQVLLNLIYYVAEQSEEITSLIAQLIQDGFLSELTGTVTGDLLDACFGTKNIDLLDELLAAGLTLSKYSGHDNYARYLIHMDDEPSLRFFIEERKGDFESMGMVLVSGRVALFKWFIETFCAEGGGISRTAVSNKIYPLLTYGGGTKYISRMNFEMLSAILYYLDKPTINQDVFRQFYRVHEEEQLFDAIKKNVLNTDTDLVGNFTVHHYDAVLQRYVKQLVAAGFANVKPTVAALVLMAEDYDTAAAILGYSARRKYTGARSTFGWEENADNYLVNLVVAMCRVNAFEGMKWLHERGWQVEGKLIHNFVDVFKAEGQDAPLQFSLQGGGANQTLLKPKLVQYMRKLGYSIDITDWNRALSELDEGGIDTKSMTGAEYRSYFEGILMRCKTDEDYDRAVALAKAKYPGAMPLAFVMSYQFVAKDDRVFTALYGDGAIDVSTYPQEHRNWTSVLALMIKMRKFDFAFIQSMQGFDTVSAEDYLSLIGNIMRHSSYSNTPIDRAAAYFCGLAKRFGVADEPFQLAVYELMQEFNSVALYKRALGTSPEIAMKALVRGAMRRESIYNALEVEDFTGNFTVATMSALLSCLTGNFMLKHGMISLHLLNSIFSYRIISEDLSSLIPVMEKMSGLPTPHRKLLLGALNAGIQENRIVSFTKFKNGRV